MSPVGELVRPSTATEVQEIVRERRSVLPRGGGTKTALSTPASEVTVLDLSRLSGVLEYDPAEFTFTALAGTPVRAVEEMLEAHGQFLPFDPPFSASGATLGGTVASGLSGPRRYRYGGVRDFVLGVRFVDGTGALVRGGGRVVKNAAGFDFPKLMVGSLGQLGVLVELTFKVFPARRAHATLRVAYAGFEEAVESLVRLGASHFDLEALELHPPGILWVRVGGLAESLEARIARLVAFLGARAEILRGEEERAVWEGAREFAWVPPGTCLVKVPVTPRRLAGLEARLARSGALRRYSVGGTCAWVAWPGELGLLHRMLVELGLAGLCVLGPPGRGKLGEWEGEAFARRVRRALDPHGKFGTG
ncbi:MAG: FAD-binding protein [Armatimonadota bacterium]|nr:FAD-binding protein [Armatimonadota bacterium]MDR7439126.1 FAD-binding protein [Armatimonadota bacterium]MDR7562153.1 FAD-binding protein [Armatimonadota bacterium]MDR7567100.1 FAD-binding protein [Armatimonadota bacterium]MDR7602347.1 FAD-binding protein [Armatimonadota bacterium]